MGMVWYRDIKLTIEAILQTAFPKAFFDTTLVYFCILFHVSQNFDDNMSMVTQFIDDAYMPHSVQMI